MESQKIKMLQFYQKVAYNMQNDERIPNFASEFKSDRILRLFDVLIPNITLIAGANDFYFYRVS